MHSGSTTHCDLTRTGERVLVSGEIDAADAAVISRLITAAIRDGVSVVDLTGVTFFSAAGVRVLLAQASVARSAGTVVRVPCSAAVERILDLCEVTDTPGLAIVPAPEAAR